MSLRKLAAESGLESLRLWGKARSDRLGSVSWRDGTPRQTPDGEVLGTGGDYYVAEGTLGPAEPTPVALPGSPDDDVEPRGQGEQKDFRNA